MHQWGGTERKCKAKITSGTNGIRDRSWVKENMPSRSVSDIPIRICIDDLILARTTSQSIGTWLCTRRWGGKMKRFRWFYAATGVKMHETHVLGSWLAIYERSCKKSRKIRIRLVAGTASIVRHTSHGLLLLRSSHCSGILHWSRMVMEKWPSTMAAIWTFHSITSTVRQFLNHKYENQGVLQKRI